MKKRVIFHIDVNSAYLSWTAVSRLQHGETVDLREIASVVGGSQEARHGIVLAKSIPAKKYDIQTGESLYEARKKCPTLVVVPPDYHLFMQCSSAMLNIIREYSDKVQQFSIDECFVDFTGMSTLFGEPLQVAHEIKDRIREELGFTVSVGVSSNKLLAKMASDLKKPDAVTTLYPEEIPTKMWPLPVSDLYMVGRATTPKLQMMNIKTIGDLAQTDRNVLVYKFKSWGNLLWRNANGIEDSAVDNRDSHPVVKGMGNSTTIHYDVTNRKEAHLIILSLVETLGMRLRHAGCCGKVISVSIRNSDFRSYGHQKKIATPVDCTNAIFSEAKQLFDKMWFGEPIRQLGVQITDLYPNSAIQLSFFEENWEKQSKVDQAVDKIRLKYGAGAVIRAPFLHSGLKPLQGGIVEDQSFPVMSSIL